MKPVYILHIYQFLKIICDFEYCMSQLSLSAFRAYYPAKKLTFAHQFNIPTYAIIPCASSGTYRQNFP